MELFNATLLILSAIGTLAIIGAFRRWSYGWLIGLALAGEVAAVIVIWQRFVLTSIILHPNNLTYLFFPLAGLFAARIFELLRLMSK